MHETGEHDLIHINEALSGLPFETSFISFEDIENGVPGGIDLIINAGAKGTAWSGGEKWRNEKVVESLTEWVHKGGVFIGVNEPSAIDGFDTVFRMAHVLGLDMENVGSYCHGKWQYTVDEVSGLVPGGAALGSKKVRLTDGRAKVLAERSGCPAITVNSFGAGKGVYISSILPTDESRLANTRLLLNIILYTAGEALEQDCVTDNPNTECAWFKEAGYVVLVNNSATPQRSSVKAGGQKFSAELGSFQARFFNIQET